MNSNKIGIAVTAVIGLVILALSTHSGSTSWPSTQITWTENIEKDITKSINYDNNAVLIGIWVGLMILGGYLLTHIHFRVLKEQRR